MQGMFLDRRIGGRSSSESDHMSQDNYRDTRLMNRCEAGAESVPSLTLHCGVSWEMKGKALGLLKCFNNDCDCKAEIESGMAGVLWLCLNADS